MTGYSRFVSSSVQRHDGSTESALVIRPADEMTVEMVDKVAKDTTHAGASCGVSAILHQPAEPARCRTAIVIVPGAPQYRVGSHRQFVLMARALTQQGYTVLRIDYPGVGDTPASQPPHAHNQVVYQTLKAALQTLRSQLPYIPCHVGLGLCDGASALVHSTNPDSGAALSFDGLILLNPWTEDPTLQARGQLKHYYLKRLFRLHTWKQLVSNKIRIIPTLLDIFEQLQQARSKPPRTAHGRNHNDSDKVSPLFQRLYEYPQPRLVLLSQYDMIATNFIAANKALPAAQRHAFTLIRGADHTFSHQQWRDELLQHIGQWLPGIKARTTNNGED